MDSQTAPVSVTGASPPGGVHGTVRWRNISFARQRGVRQSTESSLDFPKRKGCRYKKFQTTYWPRRLPSWQLMQLIPKIPNNAVNFNILKKIQSIPKFLNNAVNSKFSNYDSVNLQIPKTLQPNSEIPKFSN